MPGQPLDLGGDLAIPDRLPRRVSPAEVEDDSGPAAEQPRLNVEWDPRDAANGSRGAREFLIGLVHEVLVEDHADARATPIKVGHRPPALVDLHRAVVAYHTA